MASSSERPPQPQDMQVAELKKEMDAVIMALPAEELRAGGKAITIYRFPRRIRQSDDLLYKPRMVSIGPYHHGDKELVAMERHKYRYLHDFLARNTSNDMAAYFDVVSSVAQDARNCYYESFDLPGQDTFTRVLFLDSVFIIEHALKSMGPRDPLPIILPGLIPDDLLILDNQVPFFVLQKLYDLLMPNPQQNPNQEQNDLFDLLAQSLFEASEEMLKTIPIDRRNVQHSLHLFHLLYVPSSPTENVVIKKGVGWRVVKQWLNPFFLSLYLIFKLFSVVSTLFLGRRTRTVMGAMEGSHFVIPSATELEAAGVTIMSKERSRSAFGIDHSLFCIVFHDDGVLEIPRITMTDEMPSMLANLVALEQFRTGDGSINTMTSYVSFMKSLIRSRQDLEVLTNRGVVQNATMSNEEIANFFSKLSDGTVFNENCHYLAELFKEVNKFCELDWQRERARLIRTYFRSPWSMISFFAAFIILVLTFVQAFYAVYAYYRPH